MDITADELEQLWSDLLSRQPEVIQAAFNKLDPAGQKNVVAHLENMVNDPGWQPEQRESASAALNALNNRSNQGA